MLATPSRRVRSPLAGVCGFVMSTSNWVGTPQSPLLASRGQKAVLYRRAHMSHAVSDGRACSSRARLALSQSAVVVMLMATRASASSIAVGNGVTGVRERTHTISSTAQASPAATRTRRREGRRQSHTTREGTGSGQTDAKEHNIRDDNRQSLSGVVTRDARDGTREDSAAGSVYSRRLDRRREVGVGNEPATHPRSSNDDDDWEKFGDSPALAMTTTTMTSLVLLVVALQMLVLVLVVVTSMAMVVLTTMTARTSPFRLRELLKARKRTAHQAWRRPARTRRGLVVCCTIHSAPCRWACATSP